VCGERGLVVWQALLFQLLVNNIDPKQRLGDGGVAADGIVPAGRSDPFKGTAHRLHAPAQRDDLEACGVLHLEMVEPPASNWPTLTDCCIPAEVARRHTRRSTFRGRSPARSGIMSTGRPKGARPAGRRQVPVKRRASKESAGSVRLTVANWLALSALWMQDAGRQDRLLGSWGIDIRGGWSCASQMGSNRPCAGSVYGVVARSAAVGCDRFTVSGRGPPAVVACLDTGTAPSASGDPHCRSG
jgi:hypothetical protein